MIRALILRSPGTNCDEETAAAFRLAGAAPERLHVGALLRGERRLDEFDILAFPGGFSYGDDLGAGTVLANQLRTRLSDDLEAFVESGRLVIGICNGFQVLVRLGLLPGWKGEKSASLIENASGKFEDRWIRLRVDTDRCPFLRAPADAPAAALPSDASAPEPPRQLGLGAFVRLPVAHREGRFVVKDPETLERLRAGGQIALTYVDGEQPSGFASGYPANPNGAVEGIAGIINPQGNVLGLMPHPERHLRVYHDPEWTRRRLAGEVSPDDPADGYAFFHSAVRHARLRVERTPG